MSADATTATARPLALAITPDRATVRLALVVGGAVLVGLTSQWEIPMWPVPITLQTMSVLVVGAALGARLGGASLATYLLMGAAGLPMFADGSSGWDKIWGPTATTAGYLVGFVVAAAVVGWMAERGGDRTHARAAGMFVVGVTLIFALGAAGLLLLGLGPEVALVNGILVFLPGEVLKGAVATLAIPIARRGVERSDHVA